MATWDRGGDKWGLPIKVRERSDLARDETTQVRRKKKRLDSEEPRHEGAGQREGRGSYQKVAAQQKEETWNPQKEIVSIKEEWSKGKIP